jgi:Glutathione S-transferase, N-terminal domain
VSKVILHHYPLSPYSEKVRLALGLKNVSWSSVEIPVWTPRPKLTPMTGGYRKTPILQIGAEFYCDTLRILHAIEKLGSSGALYPKGQEGLAKAGGHKQISRLISLGFLSLKIPRAMVLTVSSALSRVTGLSCHPRR